MKQKMLLVTLLASLSLGACGGEGLFQTVEPSPAFPGEPGDPASYRSWFEIDSSGGCNFVIERGDTPLPLRIFRGAGVSDDALRQHLGSLARYMSRYGFAVSTRFDVIDIPLTHALVVDEQALKQVAHDQTGLDTSASASLSKDEQKRLLDAMGRAFLHNVRAFVGAYGKPARAVINVVVLDKMVGGTLSGALAPLAGIVGLGLSKTLLDKIIKEEPDNPLYQWLDIDGDFTPTAIVGMGGVPDYARPQLDSIIAHEVGHTLGLTHDDTPVADGALPNLMSHATSCNAGLTDEQLGELRSAAKGLTHAGVWHAASLSERGGALRGMLRNLLR
ncbi:MAG: hypothetical protein KC503_36700 [Myxococcales bacterium]|nr:hypothetical protein [Myxococcales bacterium]